MARIKVPPIATQDSTSNIEKGVGSSESQETSSSSFTSFSSTPTCPNCSNTFAELSDTDFLNHVAACSRPSTAESIGTVTTSGSSLSPPPTSPGNLIATSKCFSNGDGPKADLHFDYNAAQEPAIAIANADEEDPNSKDHNLIQPYIDPKSEFDYYDQIEGHEEIDVDINDPDIGLKFKYPKLPAISNFEKYLKNPSEMSYDELYKRAEIISTNVLAIWQKEFDAIDEEIYAYECQERERVQMEKEAEKAVEEADRVAEQLERDDLVALAKDYAVVLKSKAPEWTAFMNQFDEDDEFRLRLESLRDPQFRAKLQRQAFAREQENKKLKQKELKESSKPKLLNEPLPEIKLTKEEIEAEKRKVGRLIDPTKWDDMKQADVYGFEYSSHPKHLGAQPIPTASRKRGLGEVDMSEGRSGRAQRMATRKMYDQSTPEDESDGLPAKRQRKIRVLDDAIGELSKTSRKQSRSQTPIRRTFPSGKPIGRPPKSLSKLKDVQLASGEDEPPMLEDDAPKDEDISRHLLPSEQEQLQQSAESLVNQIAEELPVEPVVKKKHAEEVTIAPSETPAAIVPPIKPRAKVIKPKKHPAKSAKSSKSGSRVKKEANVEPSAETEEENAILPTTEHDEDSDSEATEAINSRPGSSSSQSTISSFATRKRAAASIEKSVSIQESPKKVRGKRNSGSSETPVATSQPQKARKSSKKQATIEEDEVEPSQEPVIKKEATPGEHPIISPPSSRTKRKRISEAIAEAPSASPPKKARKGRPSKSMSTPSEGLHFISASSPKIKVNKKAKGPLARILPPREPSTRARRAPKAIRNADNADEEDEDGDELNMPATEYERYQALADPRSPITLGKRVRKSVIDLRKAMEGGDDDDGDDEFDG
ncbi:97f3cd87-062b-4c57-9d58-7df65508c6cc [Sclerotinia trifoliorum]|uniref:97f3cd87-062b-4c57-9d58-7df65508c6cc n=1 Tax=Sclerotinia trifoliorum TaxID=28548 RepID=A0A8H2VP57_9HELO|nr:97f3cd87-062b-4c57-9d58-7df65508c6cc [Sclerotinia trifoliorum]